MMPLTSAGLIARSSLRGCSLNTAQLLRAVGQNLETLLIDKFKLHYGDYSVFIRELAKRAERQYTDSRVMRARLREIHYSLQDLESLDRQRRSNRLEREGLPDANSLTNTLRAAGAHVDLKDGRLVGITKSDDRCLEIRYETLLDGIHCEVVDSADLYSLFVRVYLKRAHRSR